jgi:hypothetical protein
MVTVPAEILHAPLAVIDAVVEALVVATTWKVDSYAALAGAPVRVTVGVALFTVTFTVPVTAV